MQPEALVAYYTDLLATYGHDPRSLDWGTVETQYQRFAVLASIADLNGCSVLDVGCGLADFYAFLQAEGIQTTYTGVDITPAMIATAQVKYPELSLYRGDALAIPAKYDYVLASGLFAFADETFLQAALAHFFAHCRKGVAVNLLSVHTPIHANHEFYADPATVLKFCQTLTPFVQLRHDYMRHDFTVFLYRESAY